MYTSLLKPVTTTLLVDVATLLHDVLAAADALDDALRDNAAARPVLDQVRRQARRAAALNVRVREHLAG